MRITTVFAIATAAFYAPMATHTHAQSAANFPNRLVTLVVPFTASSGSDIIARIISPKLSARWGHPVIVDNKPGASGNIGAQQVAKAPPDGHTLLMAINTFTMTPAIYKTLPYDAIGEFEPIAKLAEASFVLAVNPTVPAKDMKSLVTFIKANPGRANYAIPGNGTPQHLAMELLKANQHLDIVHIPYKGIAGALTDLMGGQVQMMFATLPSMRPLAQSGKVRLLAVTGPARSPLAPDVPTFREQGIDIMDSVDAWYAVLAPARTPPDLVARINGDFIAVMNDQDVKTQLAEMGLSAKTGSPAQLGTLIKSDLARWKAVVNASGITAD